MNITQVMCVSLISEVTRHVAYPTFMQVVWKFNILACRCTVAPIDDVDGLVTQEVLWCLNRPVLLHSLELQQSPVC